MKQLGFPGLASLVLLMLCAGCGGAPRESGGGEIVVLPEDTAWPHVVEGALEVAVEEGEVDDDGLSEINFGSVTTAEGAVMVALSAAVLRAAGLSRDDFAADRRVRATLDGPSPYSDPRYPTYRVTTLERVE